MKGIQRVDASRESFEIHRDLSITTRERRPGPPIRIDGVTIGVVEVSGDPPHGGEIHPDGDEILYVISGRLRLTLESEPDAPIELGLGDACIVRKGQWHQLVVLEPARLLHATPGPRGDHRPL
jgi:quercetin dioxygenase-like cupin family protein